MLFVICAFPEICILTLEGASPCHYELSQPVAHPAPGAEGSLCLALLCPACTAPLCHCTKHHMSKAWALNSTWWGGARGCDGDSYGDYVTANLFAPTSLPPLSFPYSSTSYTMEILCRWFKTTKSNIRCNFCTLKHDVMFQSHILSQHFMAKFPSHKWHCVPFSSTASNGLTDSEICSDFCSYETSHYSWTDLS